MNYERVFKFRISQKLLKCRGGQTLYKCRIIFFISVYFHVRMSLRLLCFLFKQEIYLNSMQKYNSYLTGNTQRFHYKDQPFGAFSGNN